MSNPPLDDPRFPHVTYRRGASGWPVPVLRGTGIRVQTIAGAARTWNMGTAEIAEDYGLTEEQVADALAFYEAHRGEVEVLMSEELQLERGKTFALSGLGMGEGSLSPGSRPGLHASAPSGREKESYGGI